MCASKRSISIVAKTMRNGNMMSARALHCARIMDEKPALPSKNNPGSASLRRVNARFWVLLIAMLSAVIVAALSLGAPVPLADLWADDTARREDAQVIFLQLRPARILGGCLVGASLAVAGVALQSVFRNPLAEPYLLGISAGGAFGAAIGLALLAFSAFVPVLAFCGALGAAAAVYALGGRSGRGAVLDRSRLLLIGVALSAFLSAALSLVVTLSNRADLAQQILFWTLGGLAYVTPPQLWFLAFALVLGVSVFLFSARDLNALRMGDDDARTLGVDIAKVHQRMLVAAALLSAAAVSCAGLIGFVGLLAPHLVRRFAGDDARILVPAAALGGAILLGGCDAVARSIAQPLELPVGVVTALLGVPLFLVLARRGI
jgi:iron complex transport system permease protein